MNEVEYVVPPGVHPQKSPIVTGGNGQNNQKPPKKSNKYMDWLKSHRVLSISMLLMAVIIVGVSFVVFTGKRVTIFGLQLNPLYNKANCPIPSDDPNNPCGGGTGGGPVNPPTPTTAEAPVVEFQVGDAGKTSPNLPTDCSINSSPWGGAGATIKPPTDDTIDCMRVRITNPATTYTKDFRVCYQIEGAGTNCTPWASEGGAGPQINSGGGFTNFQSWVETKDLPANKVLNNVKIGNQLFYGNPGGPCGASSGVAWAFGSGGSSESPWAYGDQHDNDPGCAQVSLQADLVDNNPTPAFSISGSFANGVTNIPYSQDFTVSGTVPGNCTWSIDSITPNVDGALIDNLDGAPNLTGTFQATPTAAGTYQVVLRVSCAGQSVTATLPWVVGECQSANSCVNPADPTIEGSFPDTYVNNNYSTTLNIDGVVTTPCTWELVSITPNIPGAAISASNPTTSATFNATVATAGTYRVNVKAVCGNKTITREFPFVVNPVRLPPVSALDLSATFPDGNVNQEYTTNVTTVNGASNCTFEKVIVNPNVDGATIIPVMTLTRATETLGTFAATPKVAGAYTVSIYASCPSDSGPARTANKDFRWNVIDSTSSRTLGLSGSFPDSKVNQAYSAGVQTINGGTSSCTIRLVKVNPVVDGAAIAVNVNIKEGTETSGTFTATPKAANNYTVTVYAECPPPGGTSGPTRTVQKDFTWKVTGSTSGGGGSGGGSGSSATCLTSSNIDKLTAIYRWWSPALGDHFYTTNSKEKPNGYRYEGISGYVFNSQVSGTLPIYRSSKASIGAHYYSTTDDATNYGYVNEGIIGYSFASSVSGSAPWYRLHKGDPTSDYVETTSSQEKNAIIELGYADEGIVAYLCGTAQATELQPLFRLWGAGDTDHFYTTNFAERDYLLAHGYTSEGIAGYIYGTRKDGTVPLYRSYNRSIGDHFYTTNESEARSGGYSFEGLMGYVSTSGGANMVPLHRLFNTSIGDHFYTTSDSEANSASQHGYKSESDTGFVSVAQ